MALSNVCSLCGAEDFRKCDCQWHLPFERWRIGKKHELAARLKADR